MYNKAIFENGEILSEFLNSYANITSIAFTLSDHSGKTLEDTKSFFENNIKMLLEELKGGLEDIVNEVYTDYKAISDVNVCDIAESLKDALDGEKEEHHE